MKDIEPQYHQQNKKLGQAIASPCRSNRLRFEHIQQDFQMIELPSNLFSLRDRIIDCVQRGIPVPDDASELVEWIETDCWNELMEAWGPEHIVLKLDYLSQFRFSDWELIDDGESIDIVTDEDRLIHARDLVERAFADLEGDVCPSVHAINIKKNDGVSAVLGWLVEIHGQGGPVADYCGAFVDHEHFYQRLRDSGLVFRGEQNNLTDEAILKLWINEN
jgi:hypothetical protein